MKVPVLFGPLIIFFNSFFPIIIKLFIQIVKDILEFFNGIKYDHPISVEEFTDVRSSPLNRDSSRCKTVNCLLSNPIVSSFILYNQVIFSSLKEIIFDRCSGWRSMLNNLKPIQISSILKTIPYL